MLDVNGVCAASGTAVKGDGDTMEDDAECNGQMRRSQQISKCRNVA
jgi:hypothetical protein